MKLIINNFLLYLFFVIIICSQNLYSDNNQLILKNLQDIYNINGFNQSFEKSKKILKNNDLDSSLKKQINRFIINITYSNNYFDTAIKYINLYENNYSRTDYDINKQKLIILFSKKLFKPALYQVDYMFNNIIHNDYLKIRELTDILIQYGQLDKTIEIYNLAKKRLKNPALFLPVLINIYIAQEKYDSAVIEYTNYLININFNQYYFHKFKELIYENNLFKNFINTLSETDINKIKNNKNFISILSDAFFITGNTKLAEQYYLQYFELNNFNIDIIANKLNQLYETKNSDIVINLIYKILNKNHKFYKTEIYKKYIFEINIKSDTFNLNIIKNNIHLFQYDTFFINIVAEYLSEKPDTENFNVINALPESKFKTNCLIKFYFNIGEYKKCAELFTKINSKNASSKILYYTGISHIFLENFNTAQLFFENIVLNYSNSIHSDRAAQLYKILSQGVDKKELIILVKIFLNKINIKSSLKEIIDIKNKYIKSLCYYNLVEQGYIPKSIEQIHKYVKNEELIPSTIFLTAKNYFNKKKFDFSKKYLQYIIMNYYNSLYLTKSKKYLKIIDSL